MFLSDTDESKPPPLQPNAKPRASAPGLLGSSHESDSTHYPPFLSDNAANDRPIEPVSLDSVAKKTEGSHDTLPGLDGTPDTQSMTSQHQNMINSELEWTWILNHCLQFKDGLEREKFFITYRDRHIWRRVTISLGYHDVPPGSLEEALHPLTSPQKRSAMIYGNICEHLPDVKFFDTVTNLELKTVFGQLKMHVVEDGNVSEDSLFSA